MNKKVLIIDDEPDVVTVMKFTLEIHGFNVAVAYNGEEGLSKANEFCPDLILLDVLMPKMFGEEVAVKLRENKGTVNTPIVFFTNVPVEFVAEKKESEEEPHRDAHGNIVLPKTCTEEQLLSTINTVLGQ